VPWISPPAVGIPEGNPPCTGARTTLNFRGRQVKGQRTRLTTPLRGHVTFRGPKRQNGGAHPPEDQRPIGGRKNPDTPSENFSESHSQVDGLRAGWTGLPSPPPFRWLRGPPPTTPETGVGGVRDGGGHVNTEGFHLNILFAFCCPPLCHSCGGCIAAPAPAAPRHA
jgi:hypothetical protein